MMMMTITPAKDEEVLVLDGDQGEGELHLQRKGFRLFWTGSRV